MSIKVAVVNDHSTNSPFEVCERSHFEKALLTSGTDWLVQSGQKGKEGVEMPEEVIRETHDKYKEAYQLLVGEQWP